MKREVFYEITHRGRTAGFFKTREAAERYAGEFRSEIEGGLYPVEIITREFLDHNYTEDNEDNEDNFNWDEWENGGV